MLSASRIGAFLSAAIVFAAAAVPAQITTRESVDSGGGEADSYSYVTGISHDGRYITFGSNATNLVVGDTNNFEDCFVRDRITGTTTRVSVRSTGVQGTGNSYWPHIDSSGTITTFYSDAKDLVQNDLNLMSDVFVHDSVTGKTTRVSVDSAGLEANGASMKPQVSGDGLIVAYESWATNLVAGDTNAAYDIFVFDRTTAITTRISVDSVGGQANGVSYNARISENGQFVIYGSSATNLVAGDVNGQGDVFLYDRATATTELISVDSLGNQGNSVSYNGTVSADGKLCAFYSLASNLVPGDANAVVDVFLRDRSAGTTIRVSTDSAGGEGNSGSSEAAVSADGKFVTFWSYATNLVAVDANGYPDVFRKELATGETIRLSEDSAGMEGNGESWWPYSSGDGRFVAFSSSATNLVAGDTNAVEDVFVRDSCDASWTNYGAGFSGTNGVPTFTSQADPVLGTTVTLDLANSYGSATVGLLLMGFQRSTIHTSWGGDFLAEPVITRVLDLPASGVSVSDLLSNDVGLCGFTVVLQAIEADPGAAKGVSFTPGLELVLGH